MSNLAVTNDLFFDRTGMDPRRVETIVGEALSGMDDGELFLEYSQSESVALDDGRIKSASFDTTQGFGLRAVAGEAAGYAHASELSEAAIRRAATLTSAPWCGSTSPWWSARATVWKPARTAPVGASPTNTTLTRRIGGRRSRRRCARPWSISARCRRRPAR